MQFSYLEFALVSDKLFSETFYDCCVYSDLIAFLVRAAHLILYIFVIFPTKANEEPSSCSFHTFTTTADVETDRKTFFDFLADSSR